MEKNSKTLQNNLQKEQKKRGKFLLVMIVIIGLLILSNLLGIIFGGSEYLNLPENAPSWLNAAGILLNLIEVVSFIGIVLWKKLAAWAFLAVMVISIILAQLYNVFPSGVDKNFIVFMWAFPIIIYGLLYWSIYRKWKYFS